MKDTKILELVGGTPWAIRPEKLETIRDLVAMHAAGERFTAEEIEERLAAARRPRTSLTPKAGSIAVLPLQGVIVPKAGIMSDISGGCALDTWCADLYALLADPNIAAIVLDVDSPGGSVDMVPETAKALLAAQKIKPIVAVANTEAASAAYWLVSCCSEVYVTDSGMVGSIGVYSAHQDLSGALEQEGVKVTLVKAGKYKAERSPFGPLSEDALAAMQAEVDHYYGMFTAAVAQGRGVKQQDVMDGFGQGRMVTAEDAVKMGMADGVATLADTVGRLVQSAGSKARGRRAEAGLDVAALTAQFGLLAGPNEMMRALTAQFGLVAAEDDRQRGPIIVSVDKDGNVELETEDGDEGASALAQLGVIHETTEAQAGLEKSEGDATDAEPSANGEAAAAAVETPDQEVGAMRTIEELAARQEEIRARQEEIDAEHAGQKFPDDVQAEFDQLEVEWKDLGSTIDNIRERKASLEAKARDGKPESRVTAGRAFHTSADSKIPSNVHDLPAYRTLASSLDELGGLYQDGAKRAVEMAQFPDSRIDRAAAQSHLERLLSRDTPDGQVARHILATGGEAYRRAWVKAATGKQLSSGDQRALDMLALVESVPSEGGFAIPYTLDPTVILSTNGAVNPIRSLARQAQITGHQWLGVTAAPGIVASYGAELTPATDDSPTLGQPVLEVEKAQAFVPLSIEVSEDWVGVEAELAKLFADAKDVLEANKFLFGAGHGAKEPEGLITALAAADLADIAPVIVDTATTDTFARPDMYALEDELAPRFEPGASWLANRAFYNAVRAVTDDTFNVFIPVQEGTGRDKGGNTGFQLLGYPAWRSSEMSKAISTGGEYVAVLGDFEQFLVVDRIGMSIEFVPHLFDPGSGYPIGSRGLYCYWRNSSQCLVPNAFRMLKVKPS